MTQAKINPAILRWACKRQQLSEEAIANKVGLKDKPKRLQAWERGEELPTFRQAQELVRERRIQEGFAPLPFVGRFSARTPVCRCLDVPYQDTFTLLREQKIVLR